MLCPVRRSLVSLVLVAAVGGVGGWWASRGPSSDATEAPSVASAIATAFPTAEAGFAARGVRHED